ncbi:MAG: DUF1385 domain-containing protein [Nanoarchaeota archaeon]
MKKIDVGGQAVIEGIMMRSPNYYAVATRNEEGKIITIHKKFKEKHPFLKIFFIRGIVNLIEMLVLGIKTLIWSADQQSEKPEEKLKKSEVFWTLALSMLFSIIFFVALPYFLTHIIGFVEEQRPVLFNVIDAVIKIAIFVIYIYSISLMKDVKKIFEYHGAEHKSIHCYESGKELTVDNIKKFTTLHPRCGTSFIFIVFIFSIFIFSLVPLLMIRLNPDFNNLSFIVRKSILFPLRILVIPIIAGFSYELLKLSSKYKNNILVKLITLPGILFQKITTKEPDEKQLEVAIISLKKVLDLEKQKTI